MTLTLEFCPEGAAIIERIKRLAECDDTKLIVNALSVYWELLQIVAHDGVILIGENGKKKLQVLRLP